MAFPVDPINGQTANINGVTYTYSSARTAWTVTSNFLETFTGNALIANTATVSGNINAGSITATNFVGNGSQLTGLPESYTDSNVATFLSSFGSNSISTSGNVSTLFTFSQRTITANTTIGNVNAMSAGPIVIAEGVTVTVDPGGEWSIV